MVWVVEVMVWRMSSVLRMKKSLAPWRWLRKVVTICSASEVSTASATRTVIERNDCEPMSRVCTVVYGR